MFELNGRLDGFKNFLPSGFTMKSREVTVDAT